MLARQADRLLDVEPELEVLHGEPVHALATLAARRAAELLVVGTAGRGSLGRIVLGSVSAELAARSPVPLVVVTAAAAVGERGPVVAAYDGSPPARRAVGVAARLAAPLGCDLVLAQVVPGGSGEQAVDEQLVRDMRASAILACPPGAPDPALQVHQVGLEHRDPAHALVAWATERRACLLVAGTRGRGVVGAAVLGSVSAELVRTAGRPVVLASADRAAAAP